LVGIIQMSIENWIKSKYSYISFVIVWLAINTWFIYQFQYNIESDKSPNIVQDVCESISSYLFNINLFFVALGITLSAIFLYERKTGLYFVFTYLIHTALTIFNIFQLNDSLIHYTKQQGVWGGGSPMGDFLYVCLLLIIGLVGVVPYLLWQSWKWLRTRFGKR
jgi:hypothetical protein